MPKGTFLTDELRAANGEKAPFGAFSPASRTGMPAFLCVFFRVRPTDPNYADSAGILGEFRPKSRDFGRNPVYPIKHKEKGGKGCKKV